MAKPRKFDVEPHQRIKGITREKFAVQIREQYDSGMSVRAVAQLHGRSYGNIHRVLAETDTTMRPRGGHHR